MTPERKIKFNEYRKKKRHCEICDKYITNGKYYLHVKSTIHTLKEQLLELSNTPKLRSINLKE